MKTATEILRHEHEAILRMLDVTEALARQLATGVSAEPQQLDDLLEFFRTFADRCHHGKEEDLLFPLMESKGIPRQGGPTAVMLYEHEQGRALVRAMGEAAEDYKKAVPDSGARLAAAAAWAHAARGYAELLRQHIQKENNILFVIAENMLSPEEQQRLAAEFDRVETEKIGVGTHERLHKMMDRLAAEVLAK